MGSPRSVRSIVTSTAPGLPVATVFQTLFNRLAYPAGASDDVPLAALLSPQTMKFKLEKVPPLSMVISEPALTLFDFAWFNAEPETPLLSRPIPATLL